MLHRLWIHERGTRHQPFTIFLLLPIFFLLAFFYFIKLADAKADRIRKEISKEIVFAGRYLIIELESGVPLYDSFSNIAKEFQVVGPYFAEIIGKVDLGTTFEDALNETISITPSPQLRKMLWQVLNALKTGAEVSDSLNIVFDQMIREQQIEAKEYARKLNPLAMFYMIMAIIVPSLGTTMLIVMASFMQLNLGITVLIVLACFVGFIQYMFLAVVRSQRPPMDI
ncbi:MAG: type II secretion system F family protein [Nitrosarchaeum sp.]|nr:type II secretion system F family protein [Nitrosarchaeum sp.]